MKWVILYNLAVENAPVNLTLDGLGVPPTVLLRPNTALVHPNGPVCEPV